MRKLLLLPVVGLIGAAVAVVPSLAAGSAPPSTASFTATDSGGSHYWYATGSTSNQVTIAQGGTVTFSYPSGSSEHNADFSGGPPPSSCTQTMGANSGAVPPVPHTFTGPGWSGNCTFNTPGTYTFHCDLHPYMTATIVVQPSGTTTSGSTQSTGTTTTSPTTTPSSTTTSTTTPSRSGPGGSPLLGATGKAIVVASRQRGTAVRASVKISAAGAGGALVADLFASRASLGLRPRHGTVRVGHLARGSLHAGTARLSIPLSAAAKRTLRKHRQLALTLKITVQSDHGARVSVSRAVLLRATAT